MAIAKTSCECEYLLTDIMIILNDKAGVKNCFSWVQAIANPSN